jgi:hypothetical protein
MSTSTSHRVPAGWYHDPAGSGHPRWWDGSGWTEHLLDDLSPGPSIPGERAARSELRARLTSAAGATADAASARDAPATAETSSTVDAAATWTGSIGTATGTAPARTTDAPPSVPPLTSGPSHSTFGALTPSALEAVMARIEERGSFTPLAVPGRPSAPPAASVSRRPLAGPRRTSAGPRAAARAGSDRPDVVNTLAAWIIAALPALYAAVMVAIVFAVDVRAPAIRIAVTAIFVLGMIALAVLDARGLRRAGYGSVASAAWVLLTPLAYLLLRARAVRSRTGRGYGPAAVWGALVLLQLVLVAAVPVLARLWV